MSVFKHCVRLRERVHTNCVCPCLCVGILAFKHTYSHILIGAYEYSIHVPFGIEFVRIMPDVRVVVDGVYRNGNAGMFTDHDVVQDDVIFRYAHHSEHARTCIIVCANTIENM